MNDSILIQICIEYEADLNELVKRYDTLEMPLILCSAFKNTPAYEVVVTKKNLAKMIYFPCCLICNGLI